MSAHPPAGQIMLVLLASTAMVAVFAPLTKLKAVADANLIVRPAADGEVLTELSVLEVAAAQLTPPVLIGVQLMYEHRAVLTLLSPCSGIVSELASPG